MAGLWGFDPAVTASSAVSTDGSGPAAFMQDGNSSPVAAGSGMSLVEMVVRVLFSLIIIIVIFLFIMKILAQKNHKWTAGRAARSLGGVVLGQNKSLQVVAVGNTLYIVGIGEDVRLIDKIDNPEQVAAILGAVSPAKGQERPWAEWMKRLRKPAEEPTEAELTASFQEVFHQKMKGLPNRKKWVEDMLKQEDGSGRRDHE